MLFIHSNGITEGHGLIIHTNPHFNDEVKKPKSRIRTQAKYGTRWPRAERLVHKETKSKYELKKIARKQARSAFDKRHPGQQPTKAQIKKIMKGLVATKEKHLEMPIQESVPGTKNIRANANKLIDELALSIHRRLYPNELPHEHRLKAIREEVMNARSKLGL